MANLVWFRSDLRTRDNTALAEACVDHSEAVLGIFLLAPDQWREHDWAPVKVDLILRTLAELSKGLAALNIPLMVRECGRFKHAPGVLLDVARSHGCRALHFNREYEVNEQRRDEQVREVLVAGGLEVHAHDDQTAIPPGAVVTQQGRPYTVFTPFKKAWIARMADRGGPVIRDVPVPRPAMPREPDPVASEVRGFDGLKRPDLWPGGESHALKRLDDFVSGRIAAYKQHRDIPGLNGTSTLSPYLAIGAVSPRQCLRAALEANAGGFDRGNPGCVHWIGEIVWREFYKHLIVAFPRLCMGRAFKPQTERIRWRDDPEGFGAWRLGRTGVPIVDAAVRQLLQTGWMHNRLRMVSAMYLTKDLFIDWREGERFFMRHLVDGDLASNNGGWQWSASTGTDAAPYFRIFNPVSQSRTHDPDGTFIRRFVPELASLDRDVIHEPWTIPALSRASLDYPARPVADHAAARARVMEAFRAIGPKDPSRADR